MNAINTVFLVLWCGVLVLALHGADAHRRIRQQYRADARDPRCSVETRLVFLGWARDEWYRMWLKALLGLTAGAWLLFWLLFADELQVAFADWTLALALRALTVVGVGGAVLLLSAWTHEVARERKASHPDLPQRTG